ncbi:MAG: NH(3)-dependent synthetase [Bacteroidetes bacterium]|nr:NH(3)-dependent synthetase [Bacteroidota bacterium]
MENQKVIAHIVDWLKQYSEQSRTSGFVIGISGGIDSAVTSTLCAKTGKPVICLNMPIHQHKAEYDRGHEHIDWLKKNFDNVTSHEVELTKTFQSVSDALPADIQDWLTMANTRSRLRMTTLYAFACHYKMLVAGTGNKVEDFGIGFFTKYGDGGVDVSPIADLMKSEVFALAKEMGVVTSIQAAKPTDGLFADARSDEDQIGATYDELEWAMNFIANPHDFTLLSDRKKIVLDIYTRMNKANQHKMNPIPVCVIPAEIR